MNGEGFYYELGALTAYLVIGLGVTLPIAWLVFRSRNKKKNASAIALTR